MKLTVCAAGVLATALGVLLPTMANAAASPEAKAQYHSAKESAKAQYEQARAHCDALAGNPKDVCVAEAKAARVRAEADATAQYKNTLRAYTKARKDIAEADYAVDHSRCEALAGNDKDVCIQRAKATRTTALADARADKKVIEARSNAREDKRIAEYKVAAEKCDALSGTPKEQCVSAAKTRFGY